MGLVRGTAGLVHAHVPLLFLLLLVHHTRVVQGQVRTTTTTTAPVQTTTPAPAEGLSTGVIVGLSVGLPVLVIAIILLAYCYCKKRKNRDPITSEDQERLMTDQSREEGMKSRIGGGNARYYRGFTFSSVPTLDASPDRFFS